MLELADIVRRHAPEYLRRYGSKLPREHRRALRAIVHCRTAQAGGHLYQCAQCQHRHYGYHSCHHRSCPRCGGREARQWLERQKQLLLPAPYFLVTFTLPEELRAFSRRRQLLFYNALFEQSAGTLKEIAANPRHLGGEAGFFGVLHTWTRQLGYHPHIHYVVAGGALRADKKKWRRCRHLKEGSAFLLPVRVLSARFRTRCKDHLAQKAPELFAQVPPEVWRKDWVVHSQAAGSGREVLSYLAAYIFRTAISNKRLLSDKDGRITFAYTESGSGKEKTLTLEAMTFLARLLQHVLPKGFHKVRYFGWMHPRAKKTLLIVQALLQAPLNLGEKASSQPPPPLHLLCPKCGQFTLVPIKYVPP
jgi:Putative transposase/Transposase zinc-binding domain